MDAVVGSEDEEAIPRKDAFGKGGNEGALASAFDAANLNTVAGSEVQLGEGGFAGNLGNGDGFHGDLFKVAAEVAACGSGAAQELFGVAELIAAAE